LVAIVGEAGVGKSRLVSELIRSHHVEGWRVLETGSVSYGTATSYLPVIELLKRYFLVDDHDAYRDIREKTTGRIRTLSCGLEPALPALLALLDVPVDDLGWSSLDPYHRRTRTLDAVKQLLLCEAGIQPLLVVFEDLHWVDAETQAIITTLVEVLPTARLLLLVDYRPDYRHDWAGKADYTELRLDGLSRQSAETLLSALLGRDASLRPLKTFLPEKTGGNPLFLEESVRSLIETGAVHGEKGNYRLTADIRLAHIPSTVQAIIAARIDRLTETQKQLLQTAAVVGLQVPLSVVQTVTKVSGEAVRDTLAELEASDFLYKNDSEYDVEYSFKHVVIRDVAYASLLLTRRRAIHRAVFDAVEQQFANRPDEHVERLAYHAHAAELWHEDVTYAHRAGRRAIDRSAYSEAVQFLRQALDALRHLPPSPKSMEAELDLRWDLRSALWPLGEREAALDNMRLLQLAAQRLGEPMRLARVYTGSANDLTWSGRHKEALEYGSEAMSLSIKVGDPALQINARLQLGFAQYAAGGYREAAALADVNIQTLSGPLRSLRSGNVNLAGVLAHTVGALARVETGRFNEAAALAAEANRLALDSGRGVDRIVASWPMGALHVRRGDARVVIDTLTSAWTLCNELSATRQMPWTGCLLAYARTLAGVALEENLELFRFSLETARLNELRVGEALFVVWQAESALLMGDPSTATSAANCARALAQERDERGALAWALYTLGRVSFDLASSSVDVAIGDYRSAAQLAAELGMRPLVAHCHLGLGKLYRRTDKREQAQEHLATATAMYRDMGMTYWLEKAEAEMTKPGG
jgi:tetratricopeptide (TPR) repeat protein